MKKHRLLTVSLLICVLFLAVPGHGQTKVENKYFYPTSSLKLADLSSNSDIASAMDGWLTAVRGGDKLGALNTGNRILEIMNNHKIKVVDIETDAVSISKSEDAKAGMEREFKETQSDKAS